jgi:hypothetical protein
VAPQCGKTFLFNLLLSTVRLDGGIALAVASSGIAALLLKGGATAHSRFNIPLLLECNSICNIRADSDLGRVLIASKLIVWDEAPMTHKHAFGAVDKMLRDLMGAEDPHLKDIPFGGSWRNLHIECHNLVFGVLSGVPAMYLRPQPPSSLFPIQARLCLWEVTSDRCCPSSKKVPGPPS